VLTNFHLNFWPLWLSVSAATRLWFAKVTSLLLLDNICYGLCIEDKTETVSCIEETKEFLKVEDIQIWRSKEDMKITNWRLVAMPSLRLKTDKCTSGK
jgi:hypothetical protein